MSLKIYVPKTEILNRPLLDVRYTLRLYRDLLTDLNNEASDRDVSVNEVFLNMAEMFFSQKASHAFSYPYEIRPAWKKKQAERCLPNPEIG